MCVSAHMPKALAGPFRGAFLALEQLVLGIQDLLSVPDMADANHTVLCGLPRTEGTVLLTRHPTRLNNGPPSPNSHFTTSR